MTDIMKYCICVSGKLGYIVLETLLNKKINISAVLTDKNSTSIIELCNRKDLHCFAGNPRMGRASKWLDDTNIKFDILLSVNYLFILESDILNIARLAVNFHGSLLPKYRGRTPHVWAIINGERETGITAHLMNEKCDDGDIIKQIVIPISEEDTGAMILAKYNDIYPQMVMAVVDELEKGNIKSTPQDISKATYFGKRTPDDGKINWDWQKERIRNWVRAQAHPYPGAYTFCNNNKIIINKITYSDLGFYDTIPNGTIIDIKDSKPYVKTQNGVIELTDYITECKLEINTILK